MLPFHEKLTSALRHPGARVLFGIFVVVYVLSPFDIFPDLIPALGRLDDLLIFAYGAYLLSRKYPTRDDRARQAADRQEEPPPAHRTEAADPYSILGVDPGASSEEITAKYRAIVAKYHPDKVVHLGPEFQKLAHEKMVELTRAYESLSK